MKVTSEFYTLKPYANLLYVKSFLSWDERVSKRFARDTLGIVQKCYREKPWAVLHDMEEWQLGTPEIEEILSELLNTELTNTHTHHALAVGTSQIKKWQIENIVKDISRYKIRLFKTSEDAEKWLISLGYDRSSPQF
ncbi:hypothetical protein [Desulfospira joergensenii]|uniref:hypothetical protein n=1 Tax=Desulfospira joergensenii TaxID=53329 RepID=UPI0003B63A83|nr:hypothetical protein [Desulfospira joergensenii]